MSIQIEIMDPQAGAEQVAEQTRAKWAERIAGLVQDGTGMFEYKVRPEHAAKVLDRVTASWVQDVHNQWEWCRRHGGRMPEVTGYACSCFCWHWQDTATIENDSSGILLFKVVRKYFNEVNRQLHEYKNAGHEYPVPGLIDNDWTYDAEWFCVGSVPEYARIEIADMWLLKYIENDETYVAGFFTEQDKRRLRFTSKRLGAYLASLGWDAGRVRDFVEADRTKRATAQFKLYPNDVTWGQLYMAGTESCMSKGIGSYDSDKFGVHPTDVYAAAYYGNGDNGLSLLTTQTGDVVTGRGIVNCSGEIVRWYGNHAALRALNRAGIYVNEDALQDAWLAFIGNDTQFVHPYVDGCYRYGEINGGRVYLDYRDGIDLQDTEGVSYRGTTVYCYVSDRRVPESEATYLEFHGEYVADSEIDRFDTCHITDEPTIHGDVQVFIAEDVDSDDYAEDDEAPEYERGQLVTVCRYLWDHYLTTARGYDGWRGFVGNDGEWYIQQC